jgi:hypothetical protein
MQKPREALASRGPTYDTKETNLSPLPLAYSTEILRGLTFSYFGKVTVTIP